MKRVLMTIIFIFVAVTAYADWCSVKSLGSTNETELCRKQKEFEFKQKKDKIEAKERAYELALEEQNKPKVENAGDQSGNSGIIQYLGGGGDSNSQGGLSTASGVLGPLASHLFSVEWSAYHMPDTYQLGRQFSDPPLQPTGLRYAYCLNANMCLGGMIQQFRLSDTAGFNPITVEREITETVTVINDQGEEEEATREVIRNVAVEFPGSVDYIEHTRYSYYIEFRKELTRNYRWWGGLRVGSGSADAKVVYKPIDFSDQTNQYANQPSDITETGPMLYWDIILEYWMGSNFRSSFAIRNIEASNESDDYLKFMKMGGTELVFGLTFGPSDLGVID